MAGGFGTRLRPLTCNIPKPMVPVANKPMMEHIIWLLKSHGINQITATLFYQPEQITDYFGDGSNFNVNISYRKTEADLGTAGSVKNAHDLLDSRFIIISGDVLTDFDLSSALSFHIKKKSKATILLTRSANPLQFGVVLTNEENRIYRFLEKPSWGEVFSDTINTGIYILEPEILDLIPSGEEFDFSKNLFPLLLEREVPLYGYVADGYWRDIGNLNEYQDAHFDVLRGLVKIPIDGHKNLNVTVGQNSRVETDARHLTGTVIIGKNCRIHRDAVISNSVIGDNCEILPGAVIRNSVIWSGSQIGTRAELSSDVISNDCVVGDEAILAENVFVGNKCVIGRKSSILSNVKIWPEKIVEEGATVTRSLVWEDRWLRELFTNSRVSGISNIEINSEFGAKLGAAFGAFVGSGTTVVTSRDADNVSRMMNRALMCGLMSAGVHCNDLRATSIPIVRHELRSGKERGGIHVRKSPHNKNFTDILFFDADGKDLPPNKTKSVERLFFGEDFALASYENVGGVSFPERTTEGYIERFLNTINVQAIRSAGLKLVIDYSNGIASTIFPNLLGNLNVQVVSLNAYLDNRRLTRSKQEIEQSLQELSYVVTSLKYDIGIMLDPGAEKIFAVDESGNIVSTRRLVTLMTKLILLANSDIKIIAIPISASGEIDLLTAEMGVKVIKTRDNHLAMMEAGADKQVKFIAGTRGGFVFTEFLFAADGMYSVAKILECLALTETRLGKLDQETARLQNITIEIPCPWHAKGKVMRMLMKETEKYARDLIDGVKIYPDKKKKYTSVFLNPDPTRPIFYISAESIDTSAAKELSDRFGKKILEWVDSE